MLRSGALWRDLPGSFKERCDQDHCGREHSDQHGRLLAAPSLEPGGAHLHATEAVYATAQNLAVCKRVANAANLCNMGEIKSGTTHLMPYASGKQRCISSNVGMVTIPNRQSLT